MKKSPFVYGIYTFLTVGALWQLLKILYSESMEITSSEVVILLIFVASVDLYRGMSIDYLKRYGDDYVTIGKVSKYPGFYRTWFALLIALNSGWRVLEKLLHEEIIEVMSDGYIAIVLGFSISLNITMYRIWKKEQQTTQDIQEQPIVLSGVSRKVIDINVKKINR